MQDKTFPRFVNPRYPSSEDFTSASQAAELFQVAVDLPVTVFPTRSISRYLFYLPSVK